MKQESVKIHLSDKIIELRYTPFDSDVDVDLLTRIDYENITGEVVTVSSLLNRVGMLKAEIDNRFSEEKLALDIYEAGLRKMFRSNATADGKKITIQEVDDMILEDKGWQDRKRKLIRFQKDCSYIDSVYWSVKDKSNKIDAIKGNLTPKEFENEILEGVVNGIMIKKHKKIAKDV